MELYEGLMKTADHIEQHPELYSFGITGRPDTFEPRACFLGRLGDIMGMDFFAANAVAVRFFHTEEGAIFHDLIRIATRGGMLTDVMPFPSRVAPAIREFAKRYAPAPALPESVRAIFNVPALIEGEHAHAVI
jgi:hypothetical protein